MMSDPIADLLTRIRNAKMQKHKYLDIPLSKMKVNILKVLENQGFIDKLLVNEEMKLVRVYLRYGRDRNPVINDLKRISKPGIRRYVDSGSIPRVLGGMGIAILSTNKGVVDGETARQQRVGGELLCFVW